MASMHTLDARVHTSKSHTHTHTHLQLLQHDLPIGCQPFSRGKALVQLCVSGWQCVCIEVDGEHDFQLRFLAACDSECKRVPHAPGRT